MKLNTTPSRVAIALALGLTLTACGGAGGGRVTTGSSPTAATGAAAGGTSVGANESLERCASPLGTLAVDDGRGKEWWGSFGAATQVTTIEPLIRLAVAQSNCFVITSIGNNKTESKISAITDKQRNSGEFRAGSQQQKGQRVAADYYLEPAIIIDNESTGQVVGALGGLLGGRNRNLAAIAGGLESKASVVTLTMFDIRSGVQIAISEGNATATNYGAALSAFGPSAAGSLGGFSRSPAGKATVAAFTDSYNQMVIALRNYKAQEVKGGLGKGGQLKVGN
ncbi:MULTISPECIES: hypothetical protein [Hydrogenophaga]|jgi:hypothetical protein|uniref:Curli production assembly/transport component CsgG n=1 Tax=Hydrogenophaga pseudoflava TaxID=47421 RepID=A0A4P6WUL9_HYDPS|nr:MULTISPECIES: hypothetical protein [Hydrogenophaga]OPF62901.1 hypothetical protein BC358_11960 [Hydrogenophaga sp. H7]QBM26186.1 hypothetical protein HPF_00755 [Hydrogenophaga pseudoflava]